MKFFKQSQRSRLAQAAVELAVFGGIVIFVLSLMVRQAYQSNLAQNQALKIMRMAMAESYKTSEKGSPARNTATIIVVEDRITPNAEKYGATSRTPFVLSGTGTHTRNLFMPPDFGILTELPRFDMYINGQHFVFTLAGYKSVGELDNPTPSYWSGGGTNHPDWDPYCAYRYEMNTTTNNVDILRYVGCRRFYRIVPNYVQDIKVDKFCCQDPAAPVPGCAKTCDATKNLTAEKRFDLNRDPLNNPPNDIVPPLVRPQFAWQWYLVKGFNPKRAKKQGLSRTRFKVNYGDVVSLPGTNVSLDVDLDLKEEIILKDDHDAPGRTGVLQQVDVLDSQEGDIDLTGTLPASGRRVGLQDAMQMFSFTKDGTYLLLEEGQLFTTDTRRFIRHVQKRDRLDIVQRTIQLSNDTGRYCDPATGLPRAELDGGTYLASPNPVEVCANGMVGNENCFIPAFIDKTCMDRPSRVIYVRSRIKDEGGRKWVTPIQQIP
ncbi:MAG: hypothetical protein A3D10_06230 [Omnitrophica WOR_2 bacterium RIFCSPHIGHO2_02_FULL_48_11]|nr:MAG: hypothetical protein A3D10_06230 [Omnitrophica WOR_2 bacterium RIFCSPHIGHO2_02_FULL_48_11]